MTDKPTDLGDTIEGLQAEESLLVGRTTHHGFRDASRRNRIEEQLDMLNKTKRREQSAVFDDQHSDPDK